MTPLWTVVKVGGSLYDWPELRDRLNAFVSRFDNHVLLIPGGGMTADAIRALDRTHQLGEEASHWLAIQALSLNARFLQTLVPEAHIVDDVIDKTSSHRIHVLDALPFFRRDEKRPDHLPHRWDVASDSLAVRAAVLFEARELILLKSTSWAGSDWVRASHERVVDACFAEALRQAPTKLHVRLINLRRGAD